MDTDPIQKKTYDLLVGTLKVPYESITSATLLTDLAADSIQLFELVVAFEKEFGIEANYEDLISITTVGDVIAYLEAQTAPR